MKTIIKALVFFAIINTCNGQVPADSLVGIYEGKYYYAYPTGSAWTITADTFYVTFIDSVNCIVHSNIVTGKFGGNYYTDYFSCNGTPPSNYYMKFYSEDSMKWINDDVPQPPPYYHYSSRFYGKRIPNSSWVSYKEVGELRNVSVYPNPFEDYLNIELPGQKAYFCKVIDLMGKEVFSGGMSQNGILNLERLKSGMYFLVLFEGQRILYHGKIVKR